MNNHLLIDYRKGQRTVSFIDFAINSNRQPKFFIHLCVLNQSSIKLFRSSETKASLNKERQTHINFPCSHSLTLQTQPVDQTFHLDGDPLIAFGYPSENLEDRRNILEQRELPFRGGKSASINFLQLDLSNRRRRLATYESTQRVRPRAVGKSSSSKACRVRDEGSPSLLVKRTKLGSPR